jgi:hypothetical protein
LSQGSGAHIDDTYVAFGAANEANWDSWAYSDKAGEQYYLERLYKRA